ncbi:MAG: hypothetical protein ACM3IH_11565 [Sphingobacteriales bacterium]
MRTRTTRPLVPEDRDTRLRPDGNLVRAAVVAALQKRRGVDIAATEVYPEDRVTPIILKAAADPTTKRCCRMDSAR